MPPRKSKRTIDSQDIEEDTSIIPAKKRSRITNVEEQKVEVEPSSSRLVAEKDISEDDINITSTSNGVTQHSTVDKPSEKIKEKEIEETNLVDGAEYWSNLVKKEEEEENLKPSTIPNNLYLDTINRSILDFDFEKICSITLSKVNVYCCLICGKFLQGRGKNSIANFHSINENHHVFLNLNDSRFFILPENYQIKDLSNLNDIKNLLFPKFNEKEILKLNSIKSFDLNGKIYFPGFIGLNNLNSTDYINVIVQALSHIEPLRNFCLRDGKEEINLNSKKIFEEFSINSSSSSSELIKQFILLIKKIWNPNNFKSQVSPHEFIQEIIFKSKGKFLLNKQSDPIEFLGWLLNKLHFDLTKNNKNDNNNIKSDIINDCFQGKVRIESQKILINRGIDNNDEDGNDESDSTNKEEVKEIQQQHQKDSNGKPKFNIDQEVKIQIIPFYFLTLNLPPLPIFSDNNEKNIIPQISIKELLKKYDGKTLQESFGEIKKFKILQLPQYLILHFKRFSKNQFLNQRNRTIINFQTQDLNLKDFIEGGHKEEEENLNSIYDLLINITLEKIPNKEKIQWISQILKIDSNSSNSTSSSKWYSIQDLIVEESSNNNELLFLDESYIQIWQKKKR